MTTFDTPRDPKYLLAKGIRLWILWIDIDSPVHCSKLHIIDNAHMFPL